jgi:hypothetical protein
MLVAVTLWLLSGASVTADELIYPGSRLLLRSQVLGRELEIHWSCHASRDATSTVAAHYATDGRLRPGAWRKHEGEHGFESAMNPELHVAVFPAKDLSLHSPCRAPLEAGERTVVQVSLGRRRQGHRSEDELQIGR